METNDYVTQENQITHTQYPFYVSKTSVGIGAALQRAEVCQLHTASIAAPGFVLVVKSSASLRGLPVRGLTHSSTAYCLLLAVSAL